MSRHASDDQLLDVVERSASAEVMAHVEACQACQSRVEEARAGWGVAEEAEVPEPSALYWEVFRRQVGRRLEGSEAREWRWRPALLAAGLVLVAVLVIQPRLDPPTDAPRPTADAALIPAWSPLPPIEEDEGFAILRAVRPRVDDLRATGGCQYAADCASDLSDEEGRALAELLRDEIREGAL